MAALLIRLGPLLILPVGQSLVFERHMLELNLYVGAGRKLRLLTTQQFKRAIREMGKVLIHHPTLKQRREGKHSPRLNSLTGVLVGEWLLGLAAQE